MFGELSLSIMAFLDMLLLGDIRRHSVSFHSYADVRLLYSSTKLNNAATCAG